MAEPRRLIPISADWILKRIQEGKRVRLMNAQINDDLDLSKLDLPTEHVDRTEGQKKILKLPTEHKIIPSSIEITNSEFKGALKFDNGLFKTDVTFEGVTFSNHAWFNGATFNENASFIAATFKDALFNGATFNGEAWFSEVTFGGTVYFYEGGCVSSGAAFFRGATFNGKAWFSNSAFGDHAWFNGATFNENASFIAATFKDALFNGATFNGEAWFSEVIFNGDALFYVTTFNDDALFDGATFNGDVLTFREAKFIKPVSQEEACRKAKIIQARAGNRDAEAEHFYREMEAIRIRQGIRENNGISFISLLNCLKTDTWSFWRFFWYDAIEWLFVQKIFGYGVHPWWLMGWWLVIIALFAGFYYIEGGIREASNPFDYLKVSFATAIAPGYIAIIINPVSSVGYRITNEYYQAIAMIETVVGTVLWASFIATFAKKYMR